MQYIEQRKGGWTGILYLIPLAITIGAAVVWDLRTWRIPNQIVAVGMIQGFVISAVYRGMADGLRISVAGCAIPVIVLYVLFLIRALGGGDIKLLAVVGTFVGTDVCEVMIYSFLAGGVLSVLSLVGKIWLSITNRNRLSNERCYAELRKSRIHFSLAIFAGIVSYAIRLVH